MADRALLDWYAPRSRLYPWRGERDPYRILVSEIMLQQTQAARVAVAYPLFLARFPTVRSLAAAPQAEVVRAWAGLGYNRRAVALSRAARIIVAEHGGDVPKDRAALERLPGVGAYTAAAISAFCLTTRMAGRRCSRRPDCRSGSAAPSRSPAPGRCNSRRAPISARIWSNGR